MSGQRAVGTALRVVLMSSLVGMGATGPAHAASDPVPAAGSSESADDVVQSMDPAELVRSMSIAMKTLNYEGDFVHVQGTHITSMNILHSSDDNGELERMRSLDGEAREVYRNHSLVTCIWPASQSVVVSKSKPRELLPKVDADLAANKRYRFTMGEPDRVAGLITHVVNVTPADTFRYGYRFWIDRDTHMLLRSMLLDGQRAVEQVMFTVIKYPESIDVARFEVETDSEQVSWLEPKKLQASSGLPEILADQVDRVDFANLPDGYREVSETYSPMLPDSAPISHVMLSDGMASVSVYVEYVPLAEQSEGAAGLSSMGAMNAYGLSSENAFITAVGEVPADTVQAIANAVKIH
ncbi:MucB/RseB C-terminal domain-containing protein [Granulosicoccus sp. 3-233]|uniref:MucB/RseB C-terminal domain-containing protein n=1 Tax=Granulosicoccus sp. 3-233 TaxID=3417969 RepID=UPI003D3384C5